MEISISIKDTPDGKVSIVSTPSFAELAAMVNSGQGDFSSLGYALCAIRAIRTEAKNEESKKIGIYLPRVRHV